MSLYWIVAHTCWYSNIKRTNSLTVMCPFGPANFSKISVICCHCSEKMCQEYVHIHMLYSCTFCRRISRINSVNSVKHNEPLPSLSAFCRAVRNKICIVLDDTLNCSTSVDFCICMFNLSHSFNTSANSNDPLRSESACAHSVFIKLFVSDWISSLYS